MYQTGCSGCGYKSLSSSIEDSFKGLDLSHDSHGNQDYMAHLKYDRDNQGFGSDYQRGGAAQNNMMGADYARNTGAAAEEAKKQETQFADQATKQKYAQMQKDDINAVKKATEQAPFGSPEIKQEIEKKGKEETIEDAISKAIQNAKEDKDRTIILN